MGQGIAEGFSGVPQFSLQPVATRRASSPPRCSPAASLKPRLLLSLFPPGSLGDAGWSLVLGASSELGLLLQKLPPPPPPPALCFHEPNATTGRGKRRSPRSPREGKHLFTKLRNPRLPTRIRQPGNFARLPASPRFSGGRFGGRPGRGELPGAAASQQTSRAERAIGSISSPGLLWGPAGMKLSPPRQLCPAPVPPDPGASPSSPAPGLSPPPPVLL